MVQKDEKKFKDKNSELDYKFEPVLALYSVKATVYSPEFKAALEEYLRKTNKTREQLTTQEILTLYSEFLSK